MKKTTEYCSYYDSPVGWLRLAASQTKVVGIEFVEKTEPSNANTILKETEKQLDEYFAGKRKIFDLPIQSEGSSFQNKVWAELLTIKFGQTISYAQLAKRVGSPKAFRAVGNANGKNCIPIIVPCHRVIASDGSLGGYSSGVANKKWLLEFESRA